MLAMLQHIPERKKRISRMVKHRIQQYFNTMAMRFFNECLQIVHTAKSRVNPVIIRSIVFMFGRRLEDRRHVYSRYPQLMKIRYFFGDALQGSLVKAAGVNLINNGSGTP
ncbi:hypothetical protein D3C81_1635570 [compost metagenome]